MAISTSFFLVYTDSHIKKEGLQDQWVGVRCQIRYTADALPWGISRQRGRLPLRIQFMMDFRVKPRLWAKGRAKSLHPGAAEINGRIDEVATRAVALHNKYISSGKLPSAHEFTMALLGTAYAIPDTDFITDYRRYMTYCEQRQVSASFLYNQELTIRRLIEYEKKFGKIDYERVNKTFAAQFTHWMLAQKTSRGGKTITENTAMKHLKLLRMFMNHAFMEGWTTAVFFKQIRITEKRDPFPAALTEEEVLGLWRLTEEDLVEYPRYMRAYILLTRDWFVLATQTALRYSDWDPKRLIVIPVDGGRNFRFVQKKPGIPLEVPISDLAGRVLERNGGKMPFPFTPSATMKHIAIVAKAAGIKKHITSHTARRTFATMMERAGVPRSITMRITGHKTEKDYLKYIGITFEHNADMMRKANPAWFKEAG